MEPSSPWVMKIDAAQPICQEVLAQKYLRGTERTPEDVFKRVARALASIEHPACRSMWESRFFRNLQTGALLAGRIMAGAGSDSKTTLINCFVQPVGDSILGQDEQGNPSIYQALQEAAETLRRGGGVGFDFSPLRPAGALVHSTGSQASGPCSYIDVFDRSCATVQATGARRGAQMAVLRIDHPDVMEFIRAKHQRDRWTHFNVSVAIPREFFDVLKTDGWWLLRHRAEPSQAQRQHGAIVDGQGRWVYGRLRARDIWQRLMRSAYDYAEPGVLFTDTIANDNNLRYREAIDATNPCGEQPLPAYGACDLGPLVLSRFVRHPFGRVARSALDWQALDACVQTQVRALDNALDVTYWPLPQQRAQALTTRRIGVGLTGLGDALVMLGLRYDRPEGRDMARQIAQFLRDSSYRASIALARERGCFAAFDCHHYLARGTFASRLPQDIQAQIRRWGIRNSHLLAIAPAASVSLAFADNVSSGIEPPFAWRHRRQVKRSDGALVSYEAHNHAFRLFQRYGGDPSHLPESFVQALDIRPEHHVAMMQAVQPFIDGAISKTVPIAQDMPFQEIEDLYLSAWSAGLKGLTLYRANPHVGAVWSPLNP